jgi:uncharacterized membrane protein YbhN (UPF0104 family)
MSLDVDTIFKMVKKYPPIILLVAGIILIIILALMQPSDRYTTDLLIQVALWLMAFGFLGQILWLAFGPSPKKEIEN